MSRRDREAELEARARRWELVADVAGVVLVVLGVVSLAWGLAG